MRPEQHISLESLIEELALKQAEKKIVGQIASNLAYQLMAARLAFFSLSRTEPFSRHFTRVDEEAMVEAALAASPTYEALKDRIEAIQMELNERECDEQDEVAA